jgi:hypothetical protein
VPDDRLYCSVGIDIGSARGMKALMRAFIVCAVRDTLPRIRKTGHMLLFYLGYHQNRSCESRAFAALSGYCRPD